MGRLATEVMDTGNRIVLESELDGSPPDGMVELKMEKDNGDPLHVHVSAKAIKEDDGEAK